MDEVATKIIEILKKNMKEPSDNIGLDTPLSDLDIESLDLAVIVFRISKIPSVLRSLIMPMKRSRTSPPSVRWSTRSNPSLRRLRHRVRRPSVLN